MTTHAGLSDDRVNAIIANHEADPSEGDDSHTPREVAQLAREVRARRDADGLADHAMRNRVAAFAGATEAIRSLVAAGRLDLSRAPLVADLLEECHRVVLEMEEAP